MMALQFETFMECKSVAFLKLQFINAVITPSFESPSHMGLYSKHVSINNATASPLLYLLLWKYCATLFDRVFMSCKVTI